MADSLVIALPDPCLIVLVGAAGAGKSTFAGRHFPPEAVLSSDAFRAQIAGDPGDQRATKAAFAALHRALGRRLAAGRTTVIDATSVTARARRVLVERAVAAGIPAVAVLLDLPDALVLARNAGRGAKAVPDGAVRAHLASISASRSAGVLEAEGFAAVVRLRDPVAVDAVRFEVMGQTRNHHA